MKKQYSKFPVLSNHSGKKVMTGKEPGEKKFLPPPAHIKKYTIGEKLGEGTFAHVYVALADDTKQKYAIKVFPKSFSFSVFI